MQTHHIRHEHTSGKPFSLFLDGKLSHSGKITAIKLSGIQVITINHEDFNEPPPGLLPANTRAELLQVPVSPSTANDITDSTSGAREPLLTLLQALVKSSAVKEKYKSLGGWISALVIKAGWNSLK